MSRWLMALLVSGTAFWQVPVYPPDESGGGASVSWPLAAPTGSSTSISYTFTGQSYGGEYAGMYYNGGLSLRAWSSSTGYRSFFASNSGSGQVGFFNYGTGTGDRAWVQAYPSYADMQYYTATAQTDGVRARLSSTGFVVSGEGTATPVLTLPSLAYASLPSSANGSLVYCSDCTKATPCAGSGSGAVAKRIGGAWDCD